MPPTCSLSALWDLRAKHGIQINTSKRGLEKEEEQLTQQAAWLVKSRKRIITMNFCEKHLNNFLYLCCCIVANSWCAENGGGVTLPEPLSELVKVAKRSLSAFWLVLKLLFLKCTAGNIFVFSKCTIQLQGGKKVNVLLIAFLQLWLKFRDGSDKYWIVPVRKLFYFHHWSYDGWPSMITPSEGHPLQPCFGPPQT